jgi:hypothetical protein
MTGPENVENAESSSCFDTTFGPKSTIIDWPCKLAPFFQQEFEALQI